MISNNKQGPNNNNNNNNNNNDNNNSNDSNGKIARTPSGKLKSLGTGNPPSDVDLRK